MYINVYSRSINNSQVWKEPRCPPTDECIRRCGVYTHTHTHTHTMEYYLAIKKNKVLPLATMWMELECIRPSEISQRKTNVI